MSDEPQRKTKSTIPEFFIVSKPLGGERREYGEERGGEERVGRGGRRERGRGERGGRGGEERGGRRERRERREEGEGKRRERREERGRRKSRQSKQCRMEKGDGCCDDR